MPTSLVTQNPFRKYAIAWIVIAPLLVLMALISTVKSDVVYQLQLAAFSVVALAALVLGVSALFRKHWAHRGLLVLSWLATTYFFGAAFLGLFYINDVLAAPFLVVIALPGVPFLLMALGIAARLKSATCA